jgi:PAS domain S-box-containing protein
VRRRRTTSRKPGKARHRKAARTKRTDLLGAARRDEPSIAGLQEQLEALRRQLIEAMPSNSKAHNKFADVRRSIEVLLKQVVVRNNEIVGVRLQLLETILENSAAVIYAKRKDGRYTYINREWEVVCDIRREQVLGRTDFDLFPTEIAEQFRSNDLAVIAAGKMIEYEERVGTPWGEQLFLSKKVPLISPKGEVEGLCGISANITNQREAELALKDTIIKLERERENKLLNMQAITAAIAHEVRQPLTAMVTNANAALRFLGRVPADHDEIRSALNKMINEGHRTSDVFDSIRALFHKTDQGRQPIDVNETILGVLESLGEELKKRSIETRPDLMSDLPPIVGHKTQLREVIFNLIDNALDAMNTTTRRNRELRIETALHGSDAIVVAIEDNGPGLDRKQLESIFDAFVTTKADGIGLGLAICRMIVENHGGQLSASSDGKSGAMFQCVLPIKSVGKDHPWQGRAH